MMTYSIGFLEDEEGQDLVEYGLLMSLVALVAVAVLTSLGGDIALLYGPFDAQVKAIPR